MSEKWVFEIYPSDDLWRHISIRCSTRLCFGFVFPRKGRKIIGDQRWNLKSGRGRILLPWTLRPRQSIGNSSWRHLKVNRNLSLWCVSKVAMSTLILRLFWKLMAVWRLIPHWDLYFIHRIGVHIAQYHWLLNPLLYHTRSVAFVKKFLLIFGNISSSPH